MNAAEREQVRLSLLRYLDAAAGRQFGLGERVLHQHLISEGFQVTNADTAAELDYLAGADLAATAGKVISPENRAWKITKEGRDEFARMQS